MTEKDALFARIQHQAYITEKKNLGRNYDYDQRYSNDAVDTQSNFLIKSFSENINQNEMFYANRNIVQSTLDSIPVKLMIGRTYLDLIAQNSNYSDVKLNTIDVKFDNFMVKSE